MKLRMPLETYGLLAVALADAVITVTAAGLDLHAVLPSLSSHSRVVHLHEGTEADLPLPVLIDMEDAGI